MKNYRVKLHTPGLISEFTTQMPNKMRRLFRKRKVISYTQPSDGKMVAFDTKLYHALEITTEDVE